MRVALYARVSTEAQQARGTIGSQLEALRARAAAEGDEVVAEFCDGGYSGARLDRPGLDGLRDAAEAGVVEVVRCLSPDRLARAYARAGARARRAGPARGGGALQRRPGPGRRPAGPPADPGPGRDRRVRAGQDRRALPAWQAVALPRRRGGQLEGALRLPPGAPRACRPRAP